jgi:hypothetical protein
MTVEGEVKGEASNGEDPSWQDGCQAWRNMPLRGDKEVMR